MTRVVDSRRPLFFGCLLLILSLLVALPAAGQEPETEQQAVGDVESVEGLGEAGEEGEEIDDLLAEPGADEQDLDYIDDLLEGDEDVLEGAGFSYDDGGRRDPFRSLLQVAERAPERGPRPAGVPGLLIDEVTVTGVWVTVDGPVAQVQSSDRAMSFLLRPGDQLYDGDVVSINYRRYEGAEVIFKQIIDDPTAPKPFREVVRRIEP